MATINQVLDGIKAQVEASLKGLQIGGEDIELRITKDYPNLRNLQDVGRSGGKLACVGIVDRQVANGAKQSLPAATRSGVIAKGAVISLPGSRILHGSNETISFAYAQGAAAIKENDGVGATFTRNGKSVGATCFAVASETFDSFATKFAASINAAMSANATEENSSAWVTATAVGSTVEIHNNLPSDLLVQLGSGNRGYRKIKIGRVGASIQVIVWAGNTVVKDAISDIIEGLLVDLQSQRGIVLNINDVGESVNLVYSGTFPADADTQKDVFGRHFLLGATYSIYKIQILYPILSIIPTQDVG